MKKLLLTILLNVLLLLPVVGWGGVHGCNRCGEWTSSETLGLQIRASERSIAKISAIPRSFHELRAVANNLPTNAPESILRAWDEVLGVRVDNWLGKQLACIPSWKPNRIITGNLDNPKGLIGVYERQLPDGSWIRDTKNAIADLDFPETYASNFVNTSKDGYKMLNTNRFYWNNPDQYWTDFNLPWLEGLRNSGADVVVMSDKTNDLLKYVLKSDGTFQTTLSGERILTGFGKEIQYMDNLVNQGIYQWDAVNGLYKYIGN